MNARTDGWESYTDPAGRRHWRWPAAAARPQEAGSTQADVRHRNKIGLPGQQRATFAPRPLTGK
jgi:hypothetical protein